jgi:hypothetical protein
MNRVYICHEWSEDRNRNEFSFATDSAKAADRWRRDAPRRYFVDYVVLSEKELEESQPTTAQD